MIIDPLKIEGVDVAGEVAKQRQKDVDELFGRYESYCRSMLVGGGAAGGELKGIGGSSWRCGKGEGAYEVCATARDEEDTDGRAEESG